MKFFEVLCVVIVVGLCDATPAKYRSIPRGYMIGGSYYANPRYVREGYEYIPPGQMTAMVIGDTVATNSYSGTPYNPPSSVLSVPVENIAPEILEEQLPEQITEKQQPLSIPVQEPESINETEPQEELPQQNDQNLADEQETLFSLEEGTTEAPVAPTTRSPPTKAPSRKNKAGKAKKPATTPAPAAPEAEEDEEDDAGLPASWPFGNPEKGIPSYNAFFPIFIGGNSPSGRARTRSANPEEGSYPGSATAIANSFSTGKGGVATSHATSFGDPYAAAVLRNAGLFNFRTKSVKAAAPLED